jgi:GNAT superfamily N-acetyltransferase
MNVGLVVFEMDINVVALENSKTQLAEYASIPNRFLVESVYDVALVGNLKKEFELVERTIAVPYMKDYDAIAGEHPTRWGTRFDLSNWRFFVALAAGRRVGGAAVASKAPGLELLQDRADVAVLWDIRVAPEARGKGIGSALLRAAEAWTKASGCPELSVETQNINVPACKFYQRQGFVLVSANRLAYPAFPEEIQLLWNKVL